MPFLERLRLTSRRRQYNVALLQSPSARLISMLSNELTFPPFWLGSATETQSAPLWSHPSPTAGLHNWAPKPRRPLLSEQQTRPLFPTTGIHVHSQPPTLNADGSLQKPTLTWFSGLRCTLRSITHAPFGSTTVRAVEQAAYSQE